MATSFSLVSGVDVMNGNTASSTLLNDLVNFATFSSTTASIMVGFDASQNPVDIPYGFATSGLILNRGTNYHATTYGMTIGDTANSSELFVGQNSSYGIVFNWTFNATSSSAFGLIATFGQNNPIKFQAKSFSFDVGGGANSVQMLTSGRTVVGLGGVDDGINTLQVTGGLNPEGGIYGTTTSSSASTGYVGEYIQSYISTGSLINLSNGITAVLTSILLTAGDWDVEAEGNFLAASATTLKYVLAQPSLTSSVISSNGFGLGGGFFGTAGITGDGNSIEGLSCNRLRFSLAGTTSIYFNLFANFTGTCQAWGGINARRVR